MADEKTKLKNETENTATAAPTQEELIAASRAEKRKAAAKRRRRKKIIKWTVVGIILLALAGGIWFGVYKLFLEPDPVPPPQTTYSYRGSFSNSISGYGQVKANRTESVVAPVRGSLLELLVSEGETVYEGQELFRLDDTALREQIAAAEKEIATIEDSKTAYSESIQKERESRAGDYEELSRYDEQIAEIRAKVASRNLRAPFNGKLLEVSVREGDLLSEGQTVATIVRDEEMVLRCYFSYAFEDDIFVGQSAKVSIPSSMEVLSASVTKVEKVRYVTGEGAVLFMVEVTMQNPGALAEGMEAMPVLTATDGGEITPAEAGKLEYSRTETLTAPAKGKITSLNMTAFAEYKSGDTLYTLSDDGYAADLEALEDNSASVRERVESYDKRIEGYQTQIADADEQIAKKNEEIAALNAKFDLLNGAAPMSGLVTAVTAIEGQNLEENTAILAISDTGAMTVTADFDERDVGSISVGTYVSLTQSTSEGDMYYSGTISSIALEGNYEWGYATYPVVITIDGGEGLRANSSMYYEIYTSQKDDCVLVPINAVKYTEIGACVFVKLGEGESAPDDAPALADGVVPDGFYAVPVETGLSDSSQVEIVSGIEDGVELYLAEGLLDENGNPVGIYDGAVAVG